jgi:hypothetical protein
LSREAPRPDENAGQPTDDNKAWEQVKRLWRGVVARPEPPTEGSRRFSYGVTWGLAGVSLLFIVSIVGADRHGTALWITLSCFSAAVPVLVISGTKYRYRTTRRHPD